MGLNRHTKTPCGFCFVEHYTAEAALENVNRITGLVLDDRPLRSELDFGFREGRQRAARVPVRTAARVDDEHPPFCYTL